MRPSKPPLKKLPEVLEQVGTQSPQAQVELWAMDEHRLGLKPLLRRDWQPVGFPFMVPVHPRYRWLWMYGFVCPQTGQTEWLIAPSVNMAWFNLALEQFAKAVGAGPDKRIVLVLDGAGWHRGKGVRVPSGIELVFLPPYSPQLQSAERLWCWLNEAVANQVFATLEGLEEVLAERCRVLSKWQELVSSLTQFHWWPRWLSKKHAKPD